MFPFSPLLIFWAHKAAGRQNIQVNRVRTLIAQTWTAHTTVSSSPLYCGSLSLTVTVSTAFFFFFFSFLFLNVQYPLPTPLIGWSPKLWQLSTPSTSQSLWPGSSPSTYELAGLCWGGGRLTHTHPGVCLHALPPVFEFWARSTCTLQKVTVFWSQLWTPIGLTGTKVHRRQCKTFQNHVVMHFRTSFIITIIIIISAAALQLFSYSWSPFIMDVIYLFRFYFQEKANWEVPFRRFYVFQYAGVCVLVSPLLFVCSFSGS